MAADLIGQLGDDRLHERLTAEWAKATRDRDRELALFDGVH